MHNCELHSGEQMRSSLRNPLAHARSVEQLRHEARGAHRDGDRVRPAALAEGELELRVQRERRRRARRAKSEPQPERHRHISAKQWEHKTMNATPQRKVQWCKVQSERGMTHWLKSSEGEQLLVNMSQLPSCNWQVSNKGCKIVYSHQQNCIGRPRWFTYSRQWVSSLNSSKRKKIQLK